jgi:hypothetical protein
MRARFGIVFSITMALEIQGLEASVTTVEVDGTGAALKRKRHLVPTFLTLRRIGSEGENAGRKWGSAIEIMGCTAAANAGAGRTRLARAWDIWPSAAKHLSGNY